MVAVPVPRSTVVRTVALLALVCGPTACGAGGTQPSPPSEMHALIDGVAWESSARASARRFPGDSLTITGGSLGGSGSADGVTIGIGVVAVGPGTYSIGPTAAVSVTLLTAADSWQAGEGVGSGSITFTTLTASQAIGTFQFTVPPFSTGAVGTRVVTQGRFDLTF